MKSRLLKFSLGLNLILMGVAGYWMGSKHSNSSTTSTNESILQTDRLIERKSEPAPPVSTVATNPSPLHWSDLESEDYATYVANLRKTGCPETILRRIIGGELKELYAQKAFALTEEFHRDFWEIAARQNVQEYFEKKFGQQVKALAKESDALLTQLVGEAPRELPNLQTSNEPDHQLMDFLPPDKQTQLRQLTERYEARMQAVRQANLAPKEKELQLAELRLTMEGEIARTLSPEEWSEYQLRQSSAARELQQIHGVDFSETEQRNLAKAIDDYNRRADSQTESDPATLDQILQTVLGPARFADFSRARSASYRELYEVAADFGHPRPNDIAREIFDLRIESEKRSDAIRADKYQSPEEKQASLDELHEQVEQAVFTRLGAEAYRSYKTGGGRWINSLGRF